MSEIFSIASIAKMVFEEGFSEAVRRLMHRRGQMAREILLGELRRGDKFIEEIGERDEAAAMVFRYGRSAQEGTARENLQLMAQVLAGSLEQRPIYADDFLRWADLIAGLRREEIILAAVLHRNWQAELKRDKNNKDALDNAHKATELELIGDDRVFASPEIFHWNMTALTRTGLLRDWSTFGHLSYVPSSLLDTLVKLTRMEEIFGEIIQGTHG